MLNHAFKRCHHVGRLRLMLGNMIAVCPAFSMKIILDNNETVRDHQSKYVKHKHLEGHI
jgi:hypothetical protein